MCQIFSCRWPRNPTLQHLVRSCNDNKDSIHIVTWKSTDKMENEKWLRNSSFSEMFDVANFGPQQQRILHSGSGGYCICSRWVILFTFVYLIKRFSPLLLGKSTIYCELNYSWEQFPNVNFLEIRAYHWKIKITFVCFWQKSRAPTRNFDVWRSASFLPVLSKLIN